MLSCQPTVHVQCTLAVYSVLIACNTRLKLYKQCIRMLQGVVTPISTVLRVATGDNPVYGRYIIRVTSHGCPLNYHTQKQKVTHRVTVDFHRSHRQLSSAGTRSQAGRCSMYSTLLSDCPVLAAAYTCSGIFDITGRKIHVTDCISF